MRSRLSIVSSLLMFIVTLGSLPAHGTSLVKMNLADLTSHSDQIMVARVVQLSDGFDANNLPYTEVTVEVRQTVRGNTSGTYQFRQFGLMEPRIVGDKTYLGVSPDGWPKFQVGQDVILFLYKPTALGFQSTVGLLQGKFDIQDGQASNAIENRGLFSNLHVDNLMLDEAEQKMLTMELGPVDAETFLSFVGKAVQHNWFK